MSWMNAPSGFLEAGKGLGHPSISDVDGHVVIADGKQVRVAAGSSGSPSIACKDNTDMGLDFAAAALRHYFDGVTSMVLGSGAIETYKELRAKNGLKIEDLLVYMPSSEQNITSTAGVILANAPLVKINSDGAYTLASTPTIAAGTDGQILFVEYVGSNSITLQNTTALSGSLLRHISAGSVTLGARDFVAYQYSADDAHWQQIESRLAR